MLVTPGMNAFNEALNIMSDDLTIAIKPLGTYLEEIPRLANEHQGIILSYYSLAPVEATYNQLDINFLLGSLRKEVEQRVASTKRLIDLPIVSVNEMHEENGQPLAARFSLSERIGSYSLSQTVSLNHEVSRVPDQTDKNTFDLRHKIVADIFPDLESANDGSFNRRQVILPNRRTQRILQRSIRN